MNTKRFRKIFPLLAVVLLSLTVAVQGNAQEQDRTTQAGENLQSAKVLQVEKHPEGRPFDYINEASLVPIYDDYPFYDITLQLNGKKYVVRYDNMGGYYPSGWKPGSEVKVREEGGRLYILRYDGVLVPAEILQK